MARVRAQVVHDELGRIISIARPAKDVKVIISTSDGQSVFETEIDEDEIYDLAEGSYRVDVQAQAIVTDAPNSSRS